MKILSSLLFAGFCWVVEAQAQIPNASFENWTDCDPNDWATGNACGVMTPVTKSANAQSGGFAARGEVLSFFGQNIQPVLQSGADAEGFPISQRHAAVEGYYIFQPLGGDRFGVNVAFYKDQTVIAQGAVALPSAAATYTPFKVNMTYTAGDTPNRAVIQIMILGPVTGIDFHAGSVMFVDSLAFGSGGGGGGVPKLSIERSGNSVVVSWPADVTGYRLQTTGSLNPRAWADVPGLANAHTYQFTPTTQAYFRLISQ